MISFEGRLTDEELSDSIKRNVCNRNQDLLAIIRILNNLPEKNTILALDGEWGSGKTCLIRELEILWKSDKNLISNNQLADEEFNQFRTKYIPFYYNAWENDYASNPSQSLLLALIEYLEKEQNLITKSERRLLGSINVKEFLKEKTSGLINLEGIDTNSKILEYAPEVNRSKKLRSVISELVEKKLDINEKCRFLFIIDDLDRCKPSYAVDLIEAIKNIFNSDKIVCLVATNFAELGNIVRGYYGGYIDGHQYLDRIFDLKIRLGEIDTENYISYKLPGLETWAVKNVASHLGLNMRELNRYLGIIYLYESYFSSNYIAHDQDFHDICRFIFMPIFVGYKIKDFGVYNELMSGKGFNSLKNYLDNDNEMKGYAIRIAKLQHNENNEIADKMETYYNKLFSKDRFERIDANNSFWNVINLTSTNLDLE